MMSTRATNDYLPSAGETGPERHNKGSNNLLHTFDDNENNMMDDENTRPDKSQGQQKEQQQQQQQQQQPQKQNDKKKAAATAGKSVTKKKFKKAPGAPRRFKSAFIFFSSEKHREIRESLARQGTPTEKTTNVAKMVSEAWRLLSAEEREVWEEKSRRDKARYRFEVSNYNGPWKVPTVEPPVCDSTGAPVAPAKRGRRRPKDPSAPKRPMSAFLSFSNRRRSKVMKEYPEATQAEISGLLSKMWKEAPEEERRHYIDEESVLREQYKISIAEWRAKSKREKDHIRQQTEDIAVTMMNIENIRKSILKDIRDSNNSNSSSSSSSSSSSNNNEESPTTSLSTMMAQLQRNNLMLLQQQQQQPPMAATMTAMGISNMGHVDSSALAGNSVSPIDNVRGMIPAMVTNMMLSPSPCDATPSDNNHSESLLVGLGSNDNASQMTAADNNNSLFPCHTNDPSRSSPMMHLPAANNMLSAMRMGQMAAATAGCCNISSMMAAAHQQQQQQHYSGWFRPLAQQAIPFAGSPGAALHDTTCNNSASDSTALLLQRLSSTGAGGSDFFGQEADQGGTSFLQSPSTTPSFMTSQEASSVPLDPHSILLNRSHDLTAGEQEQDFLMHNHFDDSQLEEGSGPAFEAANQTSIMHAMPTPLPPVVTTDEDDDDDDEHYSSVGTIRFPHQMHHEQENSDAMVDWSFIKNIL